MPRTIEEQALFDRLAAHYRHAMQPVMIEIEQTACGCDYGGTSWTTRNEALKLSELLALNPGRSFLDIGAGSGWPGLYLARITGCDVTLVDVPAEGLRLAAERAAADRLPGQCRAIAADGAALPFKSISFDAIGHSDVLCCLEAKLSVLRECRRVIRTDGRMVFTVISIAPDLSAADHMRAVAAGPPFKEVTVAYPAMLVQSDWRIIHHADVTAEYAATARLMLHEEQVRAERLIRLLGDAEFSERMTRRQKAVEAVENGLLRRELFATVAAG